VKQFYTGLLLIVVLILMAAYGCGMSAHERLEQSIETNRASCDQHPGAGSCLVLQHQLNQEDKGN
jgi:hypothetical protein